MPSLAIQAQLLPLILGAALAPFWIIVVLLLAGILLLITAYRTWRKEDDSDAPPKWMQAIDKVSPLQALGIGAGMVAIGVKLWVFTLSALGIIGGAKLGQPESAITYLLYIFFAQLLLIAPIVAYAVALQGSAMLLKRVSDWLIQYNRPITIAVTLIFGVYFVWQGVSGLLA
jgi:Protein of unknown function (DUF2910).